MSFQSELLGSVWHTTSIERYRGIMKVGYILSEPAIPDSERWKSGRGMEFYPYVRTLGGISLFDFREFDAQAYCEKYPFSSWYTFVPFRKDWGVSVWIEIDTSILADDFVSGSVLLEQWKNKKTYRHTIMPKIEAASMGPIPLKAFKRVLRCSEEKTEFEVFVDEQLA
ncbi:MAG: hypothetical protein KGZ88_20940 [Methylomicrobium sp.]|nr:hypothetical protein [Methylomicrobium sp.]